MNFCYGAMKQKKLEIFTLTAIFIGESTAPATSKR